MPTNLTDRAPGSDLARRERLGISADDLAARAGITAQELTSYELAKTEADADPVVAMKVADALDAAEQDLAAGENEPEAHPT
jgi:transcriptional regulator with XRE-family HTH domain